MINQDRLVETFLELVQIDSPSGKEEKMVQEVKKRLKKLGFSVENDDYGNVIAKLSGEGEPIMINAHLDTVQPGEGIKPIVEGDIIKSDGTTILGGDSKAGVAAIFEALNSIVEDNSKHLPIEVVFTLGEEVGLLGSKNLDFSKISAKRGITFDEEAELENICISSPSHSMIDVTIHGKGAHAGAEPEKGLSAIKIASEIISQLELGRIDEETTANIGLIEGGTARNAVPSKVHLKGEIRSRNQQKLEKHLKHFDDTFNSVISKYPEAKMEYLAENSYQGYAFETSHPVIAHVTEILKTFEITPNMHLSGGGTDVNIFHSHGIEAIAMGAGFHNAHTIDEYVVIPQMLQAAKFCEKLLLI